MTERAGIFRPEAVGQRDRRNAPGDVLRAAPGWTGWAFYALLGVVVAVLVAGSTVSVNRYASGPTAAAPDGAVLVLLPAALAPNVGAGAAVEVAGKHGQVVAAAAQVLSPAEVQQRYRVAVATPAVAVEVAGVRPEPGSVARVVVSSDPLIVQFVPGLRPLLGGEDG